jgi:actin-like ATPase involved in cell morphogenesis
MLTEGGAKLVNVDGTINILGEDAIIFSNMLSSFGVSGASLKRPMKDGVLNSQEETSAISILSILVEGVVGRAENKGDVCVFSAPSNPLNSDKNNTFHVAMFKRILTGLGYEAIPLNEALATIYAENPVMGDRPMSGIGMSFGAGQVNVCMAVRGMPVVEFSLVGSGDEIDRQVSVLCGKSTGVVTKAKEKKLDFDNVDYSDLIIAGLDIHYTDLLANVMKKFTKKFSELEEDAYEDPIEIIITGGTASPNGFDNKFKEVLASMDLPFEVKGVRMSSDMLNTVSKGCLLKAKREGKRKDKQTVQINQE